MDPLFDIPPMERPTDALNYLRKFKKADDITIAEAWQMLSSPCASILNKWLECEPLKATLASDGLPGSNLSPYSNGSSVGLM